MEYLKQIHIKNFRGVSNLHYSPKQVNIIIGKNNAGKSTLLDAIRYTASRKIPFYFEKYTYDVKAGSSAAEIVSDADVCRIYRSKDDVSPELLKKADDILQDKIHSLWSKLGINSDDLSDIEAYVSNLLPYYVAEFNGKPQILFDVGKIIRTDSKIISALSHLLSESDVSKKSLQTQLSGSGMVMERPADMYYSSSSDVPERRGQAYQFIYMLFDAVNADEGPAQSRVVFCGCNVDCSSILITDSVRLIHLEKIIKEYGILSDVERLTNEGVVYRLNDGLVMIPYSCHGSGFVSLLNLIDRMYSAKDGFFLIEEPENHMHPGYLGVFADQIVNLAVKLNVQVFMTTHSSDLIEEFANYPVSSSSPAYGNVIQIASIIRRDDGHEMYTYSPSEALHMMNDLLIDLRGA